MTGRPLLRQGSESFSHAPPRHVLVLTSRGRNSVVRIPVFCTHTFFGTGPSPRGPTASAPIVPIVVLFAELQNP
jgi:hypothetical protein